jgi:predicted nucleic acid-binding protein
MPSVYIETTIPSYYHETRTNPQAVAWRDITRRWWDEHRENYELVASQIVIDELRRAPAAKAGPILTLVADLPRLELDEVVRHTAAYYLEQYLVPRDALADALHVALCSVHGVGFLLTWNCRHLANANKARHLTALNTRLGLAVPIITTPFSLLGDDAP